LPGQKDVDVVVNFERKVAGVLEIRLCDSFVAGVAVLGAELPLALVLIVKVVGQVGVVTVVEGERFGYAWLLEDQ